MCIKKKPDNHDTAGGVPLCGIKTKLPILDISFHSQSKKIFVDHMHYTVKGYDPDHMVAHFAVALMSLERLKKLNSTNT